MTDDDLLRAAIRQEMDAHRIDARIKRDPFVSLWAAFEEYQRLNYRAVALNDQGRRDLDGMHVGITCDGLAFVFCRDGLPHEALVSPEWSKAPVFVDEDGAATAIFAGAGEFDLEVLGLHVRSFAEVPSEWASLRQYAAVPPSLGLVWLRAPDVVKALLPKLPADIRFECGRLRYGGTA